MGGYTVAPFAGAWIEMISNIKNKKNYIVAPFAGAWIEMAMPIQNADGKQMSLPSRERGLK